MAEDNRINHTLLRRTLTRIGVKHVDMVEDGSLAVEKCNETSTRYDLILMDMQMPNTDGNEATRLIRQTCTNPHNAKTKIIFLTAHALSDYEDKAQKAGADGFMTKPYKLQSIKEVIEAVLEEKNSKSA